MPSLPVRDGVLHTIAEYAVEMVWYGIRPNLGVSPIVKSLFRVNNNNTEYFPCVLSDTEIVILSTTHYKEVSLSVIGLLHRLYLDIFHMKHWSFSPREAIYDKAMPPVLPFNIRLITRLWLFFFPRNESSANHCGAVHGGVRVNIHSHRLDFALLPQLP